LLRNRTFLAVSLVPVACAIAFVTPEVYLPNGLSAILALNGDHGVGRRGHGCGVATAPLADSGGIRPPRIGGSSHR
jgi:hypothetical protein